MFSTVIALLVIGSFWCSSGRHLSLLDEKTTVFEGKGLVEVLYKSIENAKYGEIQPTFYQTLFLEILPISNQTLLLKDFKLWYYFQGGESSHIADSYTVQCVDSEPIPCSNITFLLQDSQDGVQKSIIIRFTDQTGYLLSNEYAQNLPTAYTIEQTGEAAYTQIRMIIAIRSNDTSNIMDISQDYSYMEAPLIQMANVFQGDQITSRQEIPSYLIPVYYQEELVLGILPSKNTEDNNEIQKRYQEEPQKNPQENPRVQTQQNVEDEQSSVLEENGLVEVLYKSIENAQYGEIKPTFYQTFFLEILPTSNQTLDLKDLQLWYFFKGGETQHTSDSYKIQCIDSKPVSCNNITFLTEDNQDGDSQKRLVIGFTNDTGYLLSNHYKQDLPTTYNIEQTGEAASTQIRMIIAIQSNDTSNFMDISNDYSYVEAPLIQMTNVFQGEQITSRQEIKNYQIPVYYQEELVLGTLPDKASL